MGDDHELVGVNALMGVLWICLALFIGHILKKNKWDFLPESCASMLLGCVIGGFLLLTSESESRYIMFSPELFFYVLLPPIIFEAGFTLKKAGFFRNIAPILAFAFIGTFLSTVLTGYILYGFAKAGSVPLDTDSPVEALMFGSLISATDPVATLAILGKRKSDPQLYSLIFGESMLNDAIAITLYHTFKSFLGKPFQGAAMGKAVGVFTGVSLGSIVLGTVIALISAYMFKRANLHNSSYEFVLTLCFAYASYCLAEISHLSGIMALFICGVTMGHYTHYNLSEDSQVTCKNAFHGFTVLAETFLYVYLGVTAIISFRPVFHYTWSLSFIILGLLTILVARAAHIFPFSFLLNLVMKRKINIRTQIMLWASGLRGAVAFALAMNMESRHHSEIVTTTMSIVVITTLVLGLLTGPLLAKLRLEDANVSEHQQPLVEGHDYLVGSQGLDPESTHLETGEHAMPGSSEVRRIVVDKGPRTGIHALWHRFDERVMKPLFGGSGNEDEFSRPVGVHLVLREGAGSGNNVAGRSPRGASSVVEHKQSLHEAAVVSMDDDVNARFSIEDGHADMVMTSGSSAEPLHTT